MEHLALEEFKFDKSNVDNQLLSGFRNSPELTNISSYQKIGIQILIKDGHNHGHMMLH